MIFSEKVIDKTKSLQVVCVEGKLKKIYTTIIPFQQDIVKFFWLKWANRYIIASWFWMNDLNSAWRRVSGIAPARLDDDFWIHTLENVFESLEALGLSIPIPKPEPRKLSVRGYVRKTWQCSWLSILSRIKSVQNRFLNIITSAYARMWKDIPMRCSWMTIEYQLLRLCFIPFG